MKCEACAKKLAQIEELREKLGDRKYVLSIWMKRAKSLQKALNKSLVFANAVVKTLGAAQ